MRLLTTLNRDTLENYPPVVRNSIVGFVVFLLAFPAYMLANYYTSMERAITLNTSIDHIFPFIPETVVIYAWVYVFLFLPVFVIRDFDFFLQVAKAFLFIAAVSVTIFVLFPVKMNRPSGIDQSKFLQWGVALNYLIDRPLNCFPSMHVSNAFMASFAVLHFSKRIGLSALLVALLISISTLTLKQHYLADVFGGLVIAIAADYIFLRKYIAYTKEKHLGKKEVLMPPWNALYVVLIYAMFVFSMFLLYAMGVTIPLDRVVF